MLMNDKFQRVGDLAADTIVVYFNDKQTNRDIPESPAIKPAVNLNLKEQLAIIRYAERSNQLSNERMQELADILNQLDGADNKMSKEKLLGIANGIMGRK